MSTIALLENIPLDLSHNLLHRRTARSLFLLQSNLRASNARDGDVTIPEQQEIQSRFSTLRLPYPRRDCRPLIVRRRDEHDTGPDYKHARRQSARSIESVKTRAKGAHAKHNRSSIAVANETLEIFERVLLGSGGSIASQAIGASAGNCTVR